MPAAIRKLIPPSIGTQGGGQHDGEAVAPPGGGGGWENIVLITIGANKRPKVDTIINAFFILLTSLCGPKVVKFY